LEHVKILPHDSIPYLHHPESFIAVIGNEDLFYILILSGCTTKELSHCVSPDSGYLKVREIVQHEGTPQFCGERVISKEY